jgi:hypothetical protein
MERLRDEPARLKTILFAPPGPKPDIGWAGGFTKIDCENGLTGEAVQNLVEELRR